jgi:hypothetical protein
MKNGQPQRLNRRHEAVSIIFNQSHQLNLDVITKICKGVGIDVTKVISAFTDIYLVHRRLSTARLSHFPGGKTFPRVWRMEIIGHCDISLDLENSVRAANAMMRLGFVLENLFRLTSDRASVLMQSIIAIGAGCRRR